MIARLTSNADSGQASVPAARLTSEAVLAGCVIDHESRTQNMIFMAYDVSGFHG
jgi:hypothetical protein